MIKILEHGVKKVICPNCKAKLQYEQEDIKESWKAEEILGEKYSEHYIICPDCGNEIVLTPLKK